VTGNRGLRSIVNLLKRSVRLALRAGAACLIALCAIFILHFLIVFGAFDGPFHNPYETNDICFSTDSPGATSRYVEYTFVTCPAPHVPLAEPAGADQAVLPPPAKLTRHLQ
jgi:hypothetical protein